MAKRMTATIVIMVFFSVSIFSCASSPDEIKGNYVSPNRYSSWDCKQIEEELYRIESRLKQVEVAQKKKANTDAAGMAVGMVLFWPALFLLAAGDDLGPELAQLKGERDALKSILEKKCVGQQDRIEIKAKEL